MLALPRTGMQRRCGHHRNRLQEQGDVRPEGIWRLAAQDHFEVQPGCEVRRYQRCTKGHEQPEPARAPGVAERCPQHHCNGDKPETRAAQVGEGRERPSRRR